MTESRYVPAKLRVLVAQRANFVCEYCKSQEDFSADPFSVEHIKPVVLGGKTIAENLAYSCQGCNSHKAIKIEAVDPISENRFHYSTLEQTFGTKILSGTKGLPKSLV